MFDNIQHPFDRLESLEVLQLDQGISLKNMNIQIKQQSVLGVRVSQYIMQLVNHIDVLSTRVLELETRLTELERK
jgi:hypothetical protein